MPASRTKRSTTLPQTVSPTLTEPRQADDVTKSATEDATAGMRAPVATTPLKPESYRGSVSSDAPLETPENASPAVDEAQDIGDKLAEQRRAALNDLGELPTVDNSALDELYKDIVSERRIDAFLAKSTLYDLERQIWVDIPSATENKSNLTSLLVAVIKTIVNELGHSKSTREIVDARNTEFPHLDDCTQFSKPDIAIKAAGPSFSLPHGDHAVGFSNAASVFDVKRDADVCEDDADQLAVYNRQLFFHQLNRVFSRSLLFTETRVRLVHCDRSGGYKTAWLNIHDHPRTFIRLILGLSSPRESALGLDTTVQWTIKNGAKVAGTIATLDASGKKVKHQLMMGVPYFVKHSVRGSGTVCWIAKNKAGKRILIKDAWRTDAQVPEYTFLEHAKGVAGVAQVLATEDDRVQTKTHRPGGFDFASPDFYNRTMCRVTMECYGSRLHKFTSQRQALAALRDAIKAHWDLLQAGILHRDVSMENILLGEDGAPVGCRGVLIDLEMAILASGPTAGLLTENQAGTYLYQSASILRNGPSDERSLFRVAHDYLDDLESFFWVLCHLLHGYEGVNQPVPDAFSPKSALGRFEHLNAFDASCTKYFYLSCEGPYVWEIPLFWSEASLELGESFRAYMHKLTEAKLKARVTRKTIKNLSIHTLLQELYNKVHHHYHDIIGLFDVALEKLERHGEAPRPEESQSASPPATPPVSCFPPGPRSAQKRKSDTDHGGRPDISA
ncbi:hypothetical protein D9611_006032 [Ephemerocybe angulata]|uniref:Fungal-type protein kinase domain-containing protein n=1 Tax=Ephemerocybe angulata TaxID=980116 RepID=A0A8H5CFS2_9AGAR|nr:hypothetical protein D9611_006032 [Tulosesus angulatus]